MDLIKNLFWEYDFNHVKINLSNIVVIERILELGNKEQFNFLINEIGKDKIIKYLSSKGKRRLSRKLYNFWREYFGIITNT